MLAAGLGAGLIREVASGLSSGAELLKKLLSLLRGAVPDDCGRDGSCSCGCGCGCGSLGTRYPLEMGHVSSSIRMIWSPSTTASGLCGGSGTRGPVASRGGSVSLTGNAVGTG